MKFKLIITTTNSKINAQDITEELVRLSSHFDLFLQYMKASDSNGKKLNFLLQEMGREINTIASKTDIVEINDIYEIYTTSPYWTAFPRSPMVMDMNFMGENYFIINNHFKCCGDGNLNLNDEGDEETRRYIASNLLKEYIDDNFPTSNVIVLGDLNDELTDSSNNNVFQMFIDDAENYIFADIEIAEGSSSEWSFPNWPSHLDHILITNELFDILDYIETIRIDNFMDGGFNEYDQNISDHRPVALKLSTNVISLGDINLDGQINIMDIVLVIEIILDSDNEYNLLADLNGDGIINIIDVVQLVNIILN